MSIDGVSSGSKERLGKKQREQSYHKVQCICDVRMKTVPQNSFDLASDNVKVYSAHTVYEGNGDIHVHGAHIHNG